MDCTTMLRSISTLVLRDDLLKHNLRDSTGVSVQHALQILG